MSPRKSIREDVIDAIHQHVPDVLAAAIEQQLGTSLLRPHEQQTTDLTVFHAAPWRGPSHLPASGTLLYTGGVRHDCYQDAAYDLAACETCPLFSLRDCLVCAYRPLNVQLGRSYDSRSAALLSEWADERGYLVSPVDGHRLHHPVTRRPIRIFVPA